MERSSTRAWRRIQKKRVWRNRLRMIFNVFSPTRFEIPSIGERRKVESWKDLRAEKWCQVYRTTGNPCSCEMCSGERYNRLDFKRETARIIREQLEFD